MTTGIFRLTPIFTATTFLSLLKSMDVWNGCSPCKAADQVYARDQDLLQAP